MRVMVTLTITGEKETKLVGNAQIFDSHVEPWLGGIGFWLKNWHYDGNGGPNNKSNVFIPWTNCMVEELKNES